MQKINTKVCINLTQSNVIFCATAAINRIGDYQIIFHVSVMVNPPVCVSSVFVTLFVMLKYNHCCYSWIFECTVLQESRKK